MPPRRPAAAGAPPPRVRAAAAAGGGNAEPPRVPAATPSLPAPRARWLDVLNILWRYIDCSVGRAVARVLHLLMRREAGGDIILHPPGPEAGGGIIIHPPGPEAGGGIIVNPPQPRNGRPNYAWQYRRRDAPAPPAPTPRDPTPEPTSPSFPLIIGDYSVSREEKDLFAFYCQERPISPEKLICHMCIFEGKYNGKKQLQSGILLHCSDYHKTGLECSVTGCRVRLPDERERFLHEHFCHDLPTGWWERKKYK